MKMPCTRKEEQQNHREARVLFRSTFNRNSSGLRHSNQQNIHSFALPRPQHQSRNEHQHQHGNPEPVAILPQLFSLNSNANISEDMTEQIRISVRDTHITRSSPDGEVGGNLADDLNDDMEESYLDYYNNLQHRSYLESSNPIGLVSRNLQSNVSISQTTPSVPSASTSSSTPTSDAAPPPPPASSSRVEINVPQQQSSSNTRLIVSDKECDSDYKWETPQNSNLLDLSQHSTETKSSKLVTNQTKANQTGCKNEKTSSQRPVQGQTSDFQDELCRALTSVDIIPFYKNNQAGVIKSYLFNGSSFSGQQNSSKESYEVNVKIQHVDFDSSYLNGYLCIAHLTKTHPTLTTFFEGEIISERYPFLTRKWEATEQIDRAHWSKFPGFNEKFLSESFDYNELEKSDYIYMRWKELFLVPDHTIKNIDGASYAGFYYVCYSKRFSQIKGFYFHVADQIESFQSLDLELDCEERTSQRQTTSAFQFTDCSTGKNALAKLDSIRISSCPDAKGDYCVFNRGKNVTTTLSVVPTTAFSEAIISITAKYMKIKIPFHINGPTDACGNYGFDCPVKVGEKAVMNLTLPIQRVYPAVKARVTLQLKDQGDLISCVEFPVQLK